MRTHVSWSLALAALVMSGSLISGCGDDKKPGTGDSGVTPDTGTPETADIILSGTTGLQTTEAPGGQAQFQIKLAAKPTAQVIIPLRSSQPDEGTVSPAMLVFTPEDWNADKQVTVTGVDDDEPDGNVTYQIITEPALSGDTRYSGLNKADVDVVNIDNDTPGVQLMNVTNLTTTEPNGMASFMVRLNTSPSADVTITLVSSDTGEVTVAPASLTFNASNWSSPQTVNLTGVDDTELDGPVMVTIATTATSTGDTGYNGIEIPDVTVTNNDDEMRGIVVTPATGLRTRENGGQDVFEVSLSTAPTSDVKVALSTSNPAEATINTVPLTFTAANWRGKQTVIVTGVNDTATDGDQDFTITLLVTEDTQDVGFRGRMATVTGVNVDDETPRINVNAAPNLTAFEGGAKATFTVSLNTLPTGDVTIPVSSTMPGQATVAPGSLVFTASNWMAPQTVTVTAVDEALADGAQPVMIDLAAATSSDPAYQGRDADNPTVNIIDNDSAYVVVLPVGPTSARGALLTNETGAEATFTVGLTFRPMGNVTIPVSSSNTSEITLSTQSVVFTPDDWQSAKTVTLKGVEDTAEDGDQPVDIRIGAATSSDLAYNGLNPTPLLSALNVDNDRPGLLVSPEGMLVTSEDGTKQGVFALRLNYRPSADVTFTMTVTDDTEGTLDANTVTFTSMNWSGLQTFTLRGVDDNEPDGLQEYTIDFGPAVSADPKYNGFEAPSIEAANEDNDTPGIVVSGADALRTTEIGGTATFQVALATQPTGNVLINLTSSDVGEGTVSPAQLTFTAENWRGLQAVTVTGVNDEVADGEVPYFVQFAPAMSDDPSYTGRTRDDVGVRNGDNDTAGFEVTVTRNNVLLVPPYTVRESGSRQTTEFQVNVALTSQPVGEVRMLVRSTATDEASVSPQLLVFTPNDWSGQHTVTVKGLGDLDPDGVQPFAVEFYEVTGDPGYVAATLPASVAGRNVDTDGPGLSLAVSTIETTEARPGSASFEVFLARAPEADVLVPIVIDPADSEADVTTPALSGGEHLLRFPAGTDLSQTVVITGRDDAIADGNQAYTVKLGPARSADASYAGRILPSIGGVNVDDDSTAIRAVASGTVVEEGAGGGGDETSFTVVLNSEPTATVRVPITMVPGNQARLSRSFVDFTPSNWFNPVTVTVTAEDDDIDDGNQSVAINIGPVVDPDADPKYRGLSADSLFVNVNDDDQAALLIGGALPVETSERRTTGTFSVRLGSQPVADVDVTFAFPVIGMPPVERTEGSVPAGTTLRFTPGNYTTEQWVTVTGENDQIADGTVAYDITLTAASANDPVYNGLTKTVAVENADDNDTPSVELLTSLPLIGDPARITAITEGTPRTFRLRLGSQPTSDVTIGISSLNTDQATVLPASVTFTPLTWETEQTITITGVIDDTVDGNRDAQIQIAPAASEDTTYAGRSPVPATFFINVIDINSAGFQVVGDNLVTYEQGSTASFTVALTSIPSADVQLPLIIRRPTEGTFMPGMALATQTLTFTSANWSMPQTVSVSGLNDNTLDRTQSYAIDLQAAISGDPNYNTLINNQRVAVTNIEAGRTCQDFFALAGSDPLPLPSRDYVLDPDLEGTTFAPSNVYCDMVTDGGGWTLLSWTGDSTMWKGAPYPGLAYCAGVNCTRGSVQSVAVANAILARSTELGQVQGITTGQRKITYDNLGSYEFAGAVVFNAPLTDLQLATGPATCAPLGRTGVYESHSATTPQAILDNPTAPIYVNQALYGAGPIASDYASDSQMYIWSIGNVGGFCQADTNPPGSFLGTWSAAQYGPGQQAAAGSYSVWAR